MVANFLRMALAGEPLTVFGDGTQTRCFTFVEDTVRGTVLAGFTPEAEGRVINIGSSVETSVNELATMIRDASGSSSAVELQPYETYYGASYEDTPRRVPDIGRAGELLGWKPEVMLGDGLARTVEWWRKTHG